MTFLLLSLACSGERLANPDIAGVGTQLCSAETVCTYWAPWGWATGGGLPAVVEESPLPGWPSGESNPYVARIDVGALGAHRLVISAMSELAVLSNDDSIVTVGVSEYATIPYSKPLGEERYDALVDAPRGRVLVADGLVFSLSVTDWSITNVPTTWELEMGPSLGLIDDCYGAPRADVMSFAVDGLGRVYFRNVSGIYMLNDGLTVATFLAQVCDGSGHVFSVTNDGSVAYVLERSRVLRADLVSGVVSSFVESDCASPVAPCGRLSDVSVHPNTGDIFVASEAPCLLKYSPDGIGEVYAGSCDVSGSSGDGGHPLDARFSSISSVAIDLGGDVYLADRGAGVVRVIPTGDSALVATVE